MDPQPLRFARRQPLVVCGLLLLPLVLGPRPARAQPSGGPYGPLPHSYAVPKAAHVYYVAPDGKAEAAGTTLAEPTTIEAAFEKVVSGDAIVMRGGTYRTGNLRLNQASRWQVQSPAGTSAWVFFTSTAQTTYLPAGAAGTWLLSPATMQFLNYGVTNAANVFEFTFTMPNAPELVGLSITSQAVLLSGTTPLLSDADCKTVQR